MNSPKDSNPLFYQGLSSWLEELDRPDRAPDALGRNDFAHTLAHALTNLPQDRSVVTAVYGPWGSGKTWLLEQVVRELNSFPASIDICRFSPWEFKSHDQILSEFFALISDKIPPEGKTQDLSTLWNRLEQLALVGSLGIEAVANTLMLSGSIEGSDPAINACIRSVSSTFPRLFKVAGAAAKSRTKEISEKTLAETKREVATALKERLPRPILVVIDDIDRLTHSEIQLIIRLLNTTANLPKLHYLIFGDRGQIASALDAVSGKQGDRYLEKLVENSFQLPEPGENQIRLRVWEGIEKLAAAVNEQAEAYARKFSHFWDAFLKQRVRNYRDCHRLLRTVAFHAGALTKDGTLEVDLMDLLAVDFLRVFDENLYQRIACEAPTKHWAMNNLSHIQGNSEKKDSARILELISSSQLSSGTACGVLLSLFPHLGSHIQQLLDQNQRGLLFYVKTPDGKPALGINVVNRTEIYFRLNLHAGELPEAKVKEIAAAADNPLHLYDLLQKFKSRKWLTQFFGRCRSDGTLFADSDAAANLLIAISQTSDSLDASDLHGALMLSGELFERLLPDMNKDSTVLRVIEAGDVTLALSLIQEFRDSSDCSYRKEALSPQKKFKYDKEKIESLSEKVLPAAQNRFVMNQFIKGGDDAFRAYCMAYALGPQRTETVLQRSLSADFPDQIWNLVQSIAVSLSSQIPGYNWTVQDFMQGPADCLLKHLVSFASLQFWINFVSVEHNDPTSVFQKALKFHIEAALRPEISRQLSGSNPDEE